MSPYYLVDPEGDYPDERSEFTREEFVAAFTFIVSGEDAAASADSLLETFGQKPPGHIHVGDDVLGLLSFVSQDCADRVRKLTGYTAGELEERQEDLKRKRGWE